jgi:hypothetical protein
VIDWSAPWLAPYRAIGARVEAAWQRSGSLADALNREGTMRFVTHAAMPAAEPYEAFVHRSGSVPVHDTLHDFFNGLVWLVHPLLKRHLNGLQAQALARDGVAGQRGALRDAVTVLDENGALLQAPPALLAALAARDWQRLFVELRPLWREATLTVVGHALLEKLLQPRKPITAHVLVDPPLTADFASKPFRPLPVLGVPGWWPANEQPGFYDDAAVFRLAQGDSTGRKPSIDR